MTFEQTDIAVRSLAIFSKLRNDVGVSALTKMMRLPKKEEFAELWATYYNALAETSCEKNCAEYFRRLVAADDNVFARRVAAGESFESLKDRAECELRIIEELASVVPDDFKIAYADIYENFAKWERGESKIPDVAELVETVKKNGYGIVSKSVAYRFEKERLIPIVGISEIRLNDLKLYEDCKKAVADNTSDFLDGLPANNVLLYGDRGSGKSSTVHAVLNEYKDRGLRLVELNKAAIKDFPVLFDMIRKFKIFKFVVFIDDLTFVDGTDDFSELKAALEGSVCRPENALIYATTNRRHLVRESFEARQNDVHINDTLQEQASLSDRFGLVVTFLSPDRKDFCEILKRILADRGIEMQITEIESIAERYALKKGGRSGRAAKQLADMIESRIRRGLPPSQSV